MRQEDIWDHEAAAGYDRPGTGMFAPKVLEPKVDRLADPRRRPGAGVGDRHRPRGRSAGTQRGVPVTSIELPLPMIEQLRVKAGETAIPVIAGDMASAALPASTRHWL